MSDTKKYIIISTIVLVLLVVLAYFFYKKGKKSITTQYLPGDLPGNPSSGSDTGASNSEIKALANELFNDIDGFNGLGHNNDVYNRVILLSDTDLVKLYNTFNTLYQQRLEETMTVAIDNEKFWENDIPDRIIERLRKLNCF